MKRQIDAGWSSLVARWAHNPKVAGSNPAPATIIKKVTPVPGWLFFWIVTMETLKMSLETQGRSGRKVTVVKGFTRRSEELDELAGRIKKTCGTGGTVKGMSLEIQGDARKKVRSLLFQWGFQVRG